MNKTLSVGIVVLVILVSLAGCNSATIISFNSADVEKVEFFTESVTALANKVHVYHARCGDLKEWTINDKQQIDDLTNWYINLSLNKQKFAVGESPGDMNGGEVYIFTFDNGIKFSYGIYGTIGNYIIITDEWYKVINPSNPFDENDHNDEKYNHFGNMFLGNIGDGAIDWYRMSHDEAKEFYNVV